MTTLKFIPAIAIVLFFMSCESHYKLSDNDYRWFPYSGNEILVFNSNNGDADTIFFLKKDTLTAYPEAQNPFGSTFEEVSIFCRHSDPAPPDGKHRYLENYFVDLEKSKDRSARLHFNLNAKDATFYKLSGQKIDSLGKQTPITFKTRYNQYNDVYVVEDEDWLNFKQRSNYVTKLYWSKSQGLIRYDKQNGIYWELEKKYSR
jgi:hypothetical protein